MNNSVSSALEASIMVRGWISCFWYPTKSSANVEGEGPYIYENFRVMYLKCANISTWRIDEKVTPKYNWPEIESCLYGCRAKGLARDASVTNTDSVSCRSLHPRHLHDADIRDFQTQLGRRSVRNGYVKCSIWIFYDCKRVLYVLYIPNTLLKDTFCE